MKKSPTLRYQHRIGIVILLLAIAIVGGNATLRAADQPDASKPAVEKHLTIDNMLFEQDSVTVDAGTKVVWKNKDTVPHNVVSGKPGSPDGTFRSGKLKMNKSFEYTFTKSGVYRYYCSYHPEMTGVVVVK